MTAYKWNKGADFMDGQPRYTLADYAQTGRYCDSFTSPLRWHIVVYADRAREYPGGPRRRFYYAVVEDCRLEASWGPVRFTKVKDAKAWAERTFAQAKEQAEQDRA